MRLTLLSRSARVPSTARIAEEARARSHKVGIINPTKIELLFERAGQDLFSRGKRVIVGDVVIPRLAPSIATYGLAVVEQFAMRGAIPMNDARAIARSRNPMRFVQVLAANGIEIPPTRMVHEAKELERLAKSLGGYPLLVKILRGTERHGTMVAETRKSLQAALEAVLGLGHDLVLQQYLRDGRGVRVWVLGGKALAALEHLGKKKRRKPKLAPTKLTPSLARTAERAARALALEVCTVELYESPLGTHVLEMNAVPSIPDAENMTGLNVAQAVVLRAEELYESAHRKAAL